MCVRVCVCEYVSVCRQCAWRVTVTVLGYPACLVLISAQAEVHKSRLYKSGGTMKAKQHTGQRQERYRQLSCQRGGQHPNSYLPIYMDAIGSEIVVTIILVNRRGHCCVQRGGVLQCCCASIEVPSPASRQKSCSCRVVHAEICVHILSSEPPHLHHAGIIKWQQPVRVSVRCSNH